MGMLGYVDDWALISTVYGTIAADARSTKKAARADSAPTRDAARPNGTPTEPTPGTDVVLAGGRGDVEDEEPDADTARADALAAPRARHPEPRRVRGLGPGHIGGVRRTPGHRLPDPHPGARPRRLLDGQPCRRRSPASTPPASRPGAGS